MKNQPGNSITRVETAARSVLVDWVDGHQSVFHHVWLRFNCGCDQCGDLDSGIGTLMITDVPEDITAREVRLDESGHLLIEWEIDGHRSSFDPVWLRTHCYSDRERERRRHHPCLWDASLMDKLPRCDYEQVMTDDSSRLKLFEQIRDLGFSIMHGAPATPAALERVGGSFGHLESTDILGRITDLFTSPEKVFITDTALPIPKHTDYCYRHAPSGIQFFQGVKTSGGGGDSVIGDGFKIAAVLRETEPEAFDLLTRVPLQFYRYTKGKNAFYSEGLAISLNQWEEVVGFRYANRVTAAPLDLPVDLVEPIHNALRKLVTLMNDPKLETRFMLNPGDILIFDNQRVLHGRTAYDDGRGERHIRRCQVAREDFHSRLRLLMIKLDRPEPRNLVLGHGALA